MIQDELLNFDKVTKPKHNTLSCDKYKHINVTTDTVALHQPSRTSIIHCFR